MSYFETVRRSLSGGVFSRRALATRLGYVAYGVVLFCLFFALKWYAARADDMVRDMLGELDTVVVDIPRVEPGLLPPGCSLEYVRILDRQTRAPLLLMKDTEVRLSVLPLLFGRLELAVTGRAYGGMVDGEVSMSLWGDMDRVQADVRLDLVELERIPQVVAYDSVIRGVWSGDVSLEGDPGDFWSMEGSVRCIVDRLDLENGIGVVAGDRLRDYRAGLDGRLAKGVLTAESLSLTGQGGTRLDLAGDMTVNRKLFSRSRLDLKGTFVAPPEKVAGAARKPEIRALLKQGEPVNLTVGGSLNSLRVVLNR